VESGQYQKATGKLPDWWDKRPPEQRGDDFFIRAFWELSSCRDFGQFLGPIPWDKIILYGERKGLDEAMIGVLEVVIRELDEVYLRDLREQRRQAEANAGRNKRPTKPKGE
jgi:hypothetical protein